MNFLSIFNPSLLLKTNSYMNKGYFQNLIKTNYQDLTAYYSLLDTINSRESLKSNQLISLIDEKPFDLNVNEINKKYKKPIFKIEINKHTFTIDICLYKIFIGEFKVRFEAHYFRKTLFNFNFLFSNSINKFQKDSIIKLIEEKYLNGAKFDIKNQYIIDNNNCILMVEDSINLRISYLKLNSEIIEKIKQHKFLEDNQKLKVFSKKQEEIKNML